MLKIIASKIVNPIDQGDIKKTYNESINQKSNNKSKQLIYVTMIIFVFLIFTKIITKKVVTKQTKEVPDIKNKRAVTTRKSEEVRDIDNEISATKRNMEEVPDIHNKRAVTTRKSEKVSDIDNEISVITQQPKEVQDILNMKFNKNDLITAEQMETVLDYIFCSGDSVQTLPQSGIIQNGCSLNSKFAMILATLFKYKEIFLEKVNGVIFDDAKTYQNELFYSKWFYLFFCEINYKNLDDVSRHLIKLLKYAEIIPQNSEDSINLLNFSANIVTLNSIIDVFFPNSYELHGGDEEFSYTDTKPIYTIDTLIQKINNIIERNKLMDKKYNYNLLVYFNKKITQNDETLKEEIFSYLNSFDINDSIKTDIVNQIVTNKNKYIKTITEEKVMQNDFNNTYYLFFLYYIFQNIPFCVFGEMSFINIILREIDATLADKIHDGNLTKQDINNLNNKTFKYQIDDNSVQMLKEYEVSKDIIDNVKKCVISEQMIDVIEHYNMYNKISQCMMDIVNNDISYFIFQQKGYINSYINTECYQDKNQLKNIVYNFPIDCCLIYSPGHYFSIFQYKNRIYEMNFGCSTLCENMDNILDCCKNKNQQIYTIEDINVIEKQYSKYQLFYLHGDNIVSKDELCQIIQNNSNEIVLDKSCIMKHQNSTNNYVIKHFAYNVPNKSKTIDE